MGKGLALLTNTEFYYALIYGGCEHHSKVTENPFAAALQSYASA